MSRIGCLLPVVLLFVLLSTEPAFAEPANNASLAPLNPILTEWLEYGINNYLTSSTLCGTMFDAAKPCSVVMHQNATCSNVQAGTLSSARDNSSVLQLTVTSLFARCVMEVEITGTVENVPVVESVPVSNLVITTIQMTNLKLSWRVDFNLTDDFPSGAASIVPSPASICSQDTGGTCNWWPTCHASRNASCISNKCMCVDGACATREGICVTPITSSATAAPCFSGTVTIEGQPFWDITAVNVGLKYALPGLMCNEVPKLLIDDKLNRWLNVTSHSVLEADVAVPPRMNPVGMHSWINDPYLDVLQDLSLYLNTPNASKWENPLLASLRQPLVLPFDCTKGGIVCSISISGLETFKILNISSTSHPQDLQAQLQLENVTLAVAGNNFTATAGFTSLELDIEATVGLNQSRLYTLQILNTTIWSLENCSLWTETAPVLESATINKLNLSYSDMRLAINGASLQPVLAPIEDDFGGSFNQLVQRLAQGPLRVQLNHGIQNWTNTTIAQCQRPGCTFSGKTVCTALNETQCRS